MVPSLLKAEIQPLLPWALEMCWAGLLQTLDQNPMASSPTSNPNDTSSNMINYDSLGGWTLLIFLSSHLMTIFGPPMRQTQLSKAWLSLAMKRRPASLTFFNGTTEKPTIYPPFPIIYPPVSLVMPVLRFHGYRLAMVSPLWFRRSPGWDGATPLQCLVDSWP